MTCSDATAMLEVGRFAYGTDGVEKNEATARLVQTRRRGRQLRAIRNVGFSYQHGMGVGRDDIAAVAWFQRAADAGCSIAMFDLALCFLAGAGVSRSDTAAIEWMRRAADAGNESAARELGMRYAAGAGVEKNEAAAVEWYKRAADAGNATAMLYLGGCHRFGSGVEEASDAAMVWALTFNREMPDIGGERFVESNILCVSGERHKLYCVVAKNWTSCRRGGCRRLVPR